jgi:predicted ATP-dependent serine protease
MLHLSIEEKDPDLRGCRVLQTVKNRFGGADATFYLAMGPKGFTEVARISAHGA